MSFLLVVLSCATPAPKAPPPPAPLPPASEPVASPPRPPVEPPAIAPVPTPAGGTILEERIYGGDAGVNGGALAIDARGNRFVVGSFRGTATFGDLPPLQSEQEDVYFLKLDSDGKPLWSKRIGGSGLDYGDDVVVDAQGSVFVSGAFESPTIDLGSGPLRCAGIHDLFLARYDGDGKLLWARRYGDARDQIDLHLRAHPEGGVIASGWFNGTVDFGAGPVRAAWNKSSFVARIDADGRGRWSTHFGHRLDYAQTDSTFAADGRLFVSGGADEPTARNDLGPVLLTFDGSGKRLDLRRFGRGADNLSTAIAADAAGGLRFVVGSRGNVDFGLPPQNGDEALYVASLDQNGTVAWSRKLMSARLVSVAAARVDRSGNTVITGQSLAARSSGFVIKLDALGNTLWQLDVDRGGMAWLSGLAFDPQGHIVVTGAVGRVAGNHMLNGLWVATIAP